MLLQNAMTMFRGLCAICLTLHVLLAPAQVEVDRRVELVGVDPSDRQVRNLGDPDTAAHALNARTLHNGALTWVVATGTDTWTASLHPAAPAPLAGMRLDVRAPADNTGPVTLAFDTLPPHAVVKAGVQPLATGDVRMGEVLSLLFDGQHWQLLNTRRTTRRPCPTGFVQVNELYCIQPQQQAEVDWTVAAEACGALNARLCSWGQWYNACVKATDLGLADMVGDWEWTNGGGNADTFVRVVGFGSCTQAATSGAWDSLPRTYRCCFQR